MKTETNSNSKLNRKIMILSTIKVKGELFQNFKKKFFKATKMEIYLEKSEIITKQI